jgi:hypothetical protein
LEWSKRTAVVSSNRPRNWPSEVFGVGLPVSLAELKDPVRRRLFRLLASRVLFLGSGDALIDWAGDALMAGWDSMPLSILAGLDKPSDQFETNQYLSAALRSLGLAMPDTEQSVHLLAIIIAGDIVSGATSPEMGCWEMYSLSYKTGYPDYVGTFVSLERELELAELGIYGSVERAVQGIIEEAQRLIDAETA